MSERYQRTEEEQEKMANVFSPSWFLTRNGRSEREETKKEMKSREEKPNPFVLGSGGRESTRRNRTKELPFQPWRQSLDFLRSGLFASSPYGSNLRHCCSPWPDWPRRTARWGSPLPCTIALASSCHSTFAEELHFSVFVPQESCPSFPRMTSSATSELLRGIPLPFPLIDATSFRVVSLSVYRTADLLAAGHNNTK